MIHSLILLCLITLSYCWGYLLGSARGKQRGKFEQAKDDMEFLRQQSEKTKDE